MRGLNHIMQPHFLVAVLFFLSVSVVVECGAQEALNDTLSGQELKQKDLEELMQMAVTSVSKHPEALFETPAGGATTSN